jgi:hypothetical protein
MGKIKYYFRRLQISYLIQKFEKLLYSNGLLLDTEDKIDHFITRLVKGKSVHAEIKAYLVLHHITNKISFSNFHYFNKKDTIAAILNELDKFYGILGPDSFNEGVSIFNHLNKGKVKRGMRLTNEYLVSGKKAYEENKHSFEGMRYIKEQNKLRSLTLIEQKKSMEFADEIAGLDREIKEVETKLDDKISTLKAQAVLDRIIEEVKKENTQ